MALGTVLLLIGGLVIWGFATLLDIFFLKWSYNRVKRRATFRSSLLQWGFLLIFKIILLVPMVLLSAFTLVWGFLINIILDIMLMKFSADIAYKTKHTFTEGFHQWAWLLLLRMVAYLILFVLFIFVIMGFLLIP